jgi:hypothetical protein
MIDRRSFVLLGIAGVASARAALAGGFAKPPQGKRPTLDRWREALAAAREREIVRIRAYRARGVFPHNHRIFGRTPEFIDARGVPCAVGFLMQQSGYGDLAADISHNDNNVYIETIKDGPAFEWMLHSGLTQEECAYIQPSYNWRPRPVPVRPPPPPPQDYERERLIAHFTNVEQQLVAETKVSLDRALERLGSRIAKGDTIDHVVG